MNHSQHNPLPGIEELETRRLLAVTLTGSTLEIHTGNEDDVIVVRKKDTLLVVEFNAKKKKFDRETVKRLDIETRDGDDQIDLERAYERAYINCGEDEDRVVGSNRDDSISGAEGDDVIDGRDGNDTINGGSDRDSLYGDVGNDFIEGGDDRDWIYGEAGDDDIDADDDAWEDNINGGPGNDHADIDDDLGIEDDVINVEDTEE